MRIKTADALIKNIASSSLPKSVSAPKHPHHLECDSEIAPAQFFTKSICEATCTPLDVYRKEQKTVVFTAKSAQIAVDKKGAVGSDSDACDAKTEYELESYARDRYAEGAQERTAKISDQGPLNDVLPRGDAGKNQYDNLARPQNDNDSRNSLVFDCGNSSVHVHRALGKPSARQNDNSGGGKNDGDARRSRSLRSLGQSGEESFPQARCENGVARAGTEHASAVEINRMLGIPPGALFLSTAQAAQALGRKPQTLRKWASSQSGPVLPKRIGGRLAWFAQDIRSLVFGDEKR